MTPPSWYTPAPVDVWVQRRAAKTLAAYLSELSEDQFGKAWAVHLDEIGLAACDGIGPFAEHGPNLRVLANLAHGWVVWGPISTEQCLINPDDDERDGVQWVRWYKEEPDEVPY